MSDVQRARQRLAELELQYAQGTVPADVIQANRQVLRMLKANGHASMPPLMTREQKVLRQEVQTCLEGWRRHGERSTNPTIKALAEQLEHARDATTAVQLSFRLFAVMAKALAQAERRISELEKTND